MRFTPQQKLEIIGKHQHLGVSVYSLCREYNISKVTFYKWLALYRKSKRNQIGALSSKVRRGKSHPKSLDYKLKLAILGVVHEHPEYSSHKIAEVLGIGNFGVQTFLYKDGLNKYEARLAFSGKPFWKRESAQSREGMMDLHRQGWSTADICHHFKISKPNFYKWKRRWDAAYEDQKRQVLADRYVSGSEHHKYLDEGKKRQIVELVKVNPELSVHKIHRQLAGLVGHFTVQQVLAQRDLNTYEKRLRFAQGYSQQPEVQIAPLYAPQIPLYKLRHLIAHFATVPKLLLTDPKRGFRPAFFSVASLALLFFWIRLLVTTPGASPIGLFFASMALMFGLFFLVYSLKYYLTVLLVLRLAQNGGAQGVSKLEMRVRDYAGKVPFLKDFTKNLGERSSESRVNPLTLNLDNVSLTSHPFVSVHVALYNERRVVERLIRACESQEYYEEVTKVTKESKESKVGSAAYEVIIADDSTDETTEIAKSLLSGEGRILDRTRFDEQMEVYVSSPPVGSSLPVIKLIHRFSRSGFKGAALQGALQNTSPKAEYISIFDADFVPFPDTLSQFVKSFQEVCGGLDKVKDSKIAAVQGYQWHVLNKSQTWITRGVRTEYAGSYVIERAGEEIYGGLKQIAGSVYAIRADILRQFGWGTSITEDFELTLRLYERGYKVAFTPYIQAPAEAVSTIKRLVRQRMRWAEGASHNIKVMLPRMLWGRWEDSQEVTKVTNESKESNVLETSDSSDSSVTSDSPSKVWVPSGLTRAEKLEFAYLVPYYLQAAFFIIGTFSWFISEQVFGARLPFWTAALGWSLVFTNILALPLMNIVGLFLEESEERDYAGILSFIALSYIVVPFQAYAAIKGFMEKEEGPWFRTPKTGIVTDTFGRSRFSKFFGDLLGRAGASPVQSLPNINFRPQTKLAFNFNANLGQIRVRLTPKRKLIGNLVSIALVVSITILPLLIPMASKFSDVSAQTPPSNASVVTSIPRATHSIASEQVGGTNAHVVIINSPGQTLSYKYQFLTGGVRLYIDKKDGQGWVQLVSQIQTAPEYMKQQGAPGNFNWNPYGLNINTTGANVLQGFERVDEGNGSTTLTRSYSTSEEGIAETLTETWAIPKTTEDLAAKGPKATYSMTKNRGIVLTKGVNEGTWRMRWAISGISDIVSDNSDIKDESGWPIRTKEYLGGLVKVDVNDFDNAQNDINAFSFSEVAANNKAEILFFKNGITGDRIVDPSLVTACGGSGCASPWTSSKQRNVFYNGANFFVFYTKGSTSLFARGASTIGDLSSATEQTVLNDLMSASADFDIYVVNDAKFDLVYQDKTNSTDVKSSTCSISGSTISSCSSAATYVAGAAFTSVSITRTPSADRVWIGEKRGNATEIISADTTGDLTSSTAYTQQALNGVTAVNNVSVLAYAGSDKIILFHQRDPGGAGSDGIWSRTCDISSSCSSMVSIASGNNALAQADNFGNGIRISDTDFRFVYVDATATTQLIEAQFNGNVTWTVTEVIDTGGGQTYPSLFYDPDENVEYAFYADSATPTSIQRYHKPTASTYSTNWDSKTDVDAGESDNNSLAVTQMKETPSTTRTPRELMWCYLNANSTNFDVVCGNVNLAAVPENIFLMATFAPVLWLFIQRIDKRRRLKMYLPR